MNLFNDENKNEGLDIPDFIEDNDKDTGSVDMSIFKMSDEELYGDSKKKKSEKLEETTEKKKNSNSTIILCLILIVILFIAAVGGIIFAVKKNSDYTKANDELTQVKATINDYQTRINNLTEQVNTLNEKIEELKKADTKSDPNSKYPKGTVLYVTEDGQGMTIKKQASMDAEAIDAAQTYADWGDKFTLLEDATLDSNGNYWGKTEKGYIRIEYNGEIWCSKEQQ